MTWKLQKGNGIEIGKSCKHLQIHKNNKNILYVPFTMVCKINNTVNNNWKFFLFLTFDIV